MAEFAPTPSVLMELREERSVIKEGYHFLDEKRLLLAAEILRQLAGYEKLEREFSARQENAVTALVAAMERHGLEGLQVFPPAAMDDARLNLRTRTFLGVRLLEASLEIGLLAEPAPAVDPSPEAPTCAASFRSLVELAARLAAVQGNLERLLAEYRRAARRARALEDVILPEVEENLKEVAIRLEELEQEDAVRVRLDYGLKKT